MQHFSVACGCYILSYKESKDEKNSGLNKLTIDHLSMWLGSSVDRALHRYRKVMGSNPIQA